MTNTPEEALELLRKYLPPSTVTTLEARWHKETLQEFATDPEVRRTLVAIEDVHAQRRYQKTQFELAGAESNPKVEPPYRPVDAVVGTVRGLDAQLTGELYPRLNRAVATVEALAWSIVTMPQDQGVAQVDRSAPTIGRPAPDLSGPGPLPVPRIPWYPESGHGQPVPSTGQPVQGRPGIPTAGSAWDVRVPGEHGTVPLQGPPTAPTGPTPGPQAAPNPQVSMARYQLDSRTSTEAPPPTTAAPTAQPPAAGRRPGRGK
jgi:hypothetical protein